MDPQSTLEMIEKCLIDKEYSDAEDLAWDLFKWIKRGGFEPDWSIYPKASYYYTGTTKEGIHWGRQNQKKGE